MSTCYTSPATQTAPTRKPRYTVQNTNEACTVRVELPGVPKDNLSINHEADVLTIQGQRKTALPETWKPLHRELNDLGYTLRLKLNATVDSANLSAQFTDGVLTLQIPLRTSTKPRRIEVN